MINIMLAGCNGYMGSVVTSLIDDHPDVTIFCGYDVRRLTKNGKGYGYTVWETGDLLTTNNFMDKVDVIIDFSSPAALEDLLIIASGKNNRMLMSPIPLILCATGYSDEQTKIIEEASKTIPIFRSGNMSLGINLLSDLIQRACKVLGEDFDIEIVERHHRRKVDAPSGTALMLADAAAEVMQNKPEYVYERESKREPRGDNEIGISAVRGGTIVGVHDVIFAGQDEVIELRHTAASREVFAAGALKAAKFMAGKSPGLYNMKDVLEHS